MSFTFKLQHNLNYRTVGFIILTFLPVYLFYLMIFVFSINIPYWDDYDSILNFTNNFIGSDIQNKLNLIFSQHNEHRIAFSRLVTIASYYLIGKINFRFLTILGSLSLIGVAIIFLKSFASTKKGFLYFIPVLLLLFQQQYWGDIYFATTALSNLWGLFFAFASLYLLKQESKGYFLLSILLGIIAVFTNGSGMLIFLAGLTIFIFKKRYREMLIWLFVGIGCIFFYFYGYVKPVNQPSLNEAIFMYPFLTIVYFFKFLGLCFSGIGKGGFLPFLGGVFFVLYYVYLIKKKFYKKSPVIFSFLTFLLATGIINAICRSAFGAFPSRYKIISVLILILSYMSLTELLTEKQMRSILPIFFIFAVMFNLFSYFINYNYIFLQRKYLKDGLVLWENGKSGLSYPDAKRANSILTTAIMKKQYSPPRL